jgi:acetyl-CoA carboxylase biotin carboxylase subunit
VAAFDRASSEAQTAFGNPAIYVERFLQNTRHIEVQLLGDGRGNVVHLGERECSLQRRHQKLVEEAPSPVLHPAVRDRITAAACALAARIEYRGAGTAEFLVENAHDADQAQFFFMEVNTRLQVEHPVTEAVFGVDLVRDQLRIARGGPLGYEQADLVPRGHAIETRIYAEDPERGFVPSTGQIGAAELPMGPGTRVDTALFAGDRVSVYYDPLIGKLTVWGRTRAEAVARLERALSEMRITGVKTTIPLLRHVARAEAFRRADFHIHWLEPFAKRELATPPTARRWKRAAVAAAVQAAERARRGSVAAAAVGAGTEGPGHLSPWTLAGRSAQLGGGA